MFCENCGSEIKEGDEFCTNCGHRIVQDLSCQVDKTMSVMTSERASQSRNIDLKVKKKSRLPIILALTTVALAAVVILVLVVAGNNSSSARVKKHLQLAQRYLEELNYEQAIAEYEAAIEIDPQNPDAYEKLAELYILQGNYDQAAAILKNGIKVTDNANLISLEEQVQNRIQEIASCV